MCFQMSEFEFQTYLGGFPPPYFGKCPKFPRFLIMRPSLIRKALLSTTILQVQGVEDVD